MTSKKRKTRRPYMAGPEAIQKIEELGAQLAGSRKNVDAWMERAGQAERSLAEAREFLVAEERNLRAAKLDLHDLGRQLKEEKERGTKIAANFQEAANERDALRKVVDQQGKDFAAAVESSDAKHIRALEAVIEDSRRGFMAAFGIERQLSMTHLIEMAGRLQHELQGMREGFSTTERAAAHERIQKLEGEINAIREALTTAERDCSNYSKAADDWKRRAATLEVRLEEWPNLIEQFHAGEQHRRELQSKISRQKAELERLYVDQIDLRGKLQELRAHPPIVSLAMEETRQLREARDKFQGEVVVLEKIVDTLRQRIGEAVGHYAGHPILTVPECIARLAYVRDERARSKTINPVEIPMEANPGSMVYFLRLERDKLRQQLERIREAAK